MQQCPNLWAVAATPKAYNIQWQILKLKEPSRAIMCRTSSKYDKHFRKGDLAASIMRGLAIEGSRWQS